jgi:peptidoglycan-N-acetylglucosamine deacetylase
MLNFRTANIFLVIFAVVAILLMIFKLQYFWLLLILAGLYLYLLVQGSTKVCLGFYTKVFCKGVTVEKIVALTFDDGPDEIYTPVIIDILDKQNVPATFFIIGKKAEVQHDILKNIDNKKHLIGNHSYSHALLFDLFGRKKMEQDLIMADSVIEKITGKRPAMFRPPYGVTNPIVARVVKRLGYNVIGWSIKSLDTVLKDEDKIVERIQDRLHPGAVILMHDDREITAKVLEKVILMIKKEGYRIVKLDEVL